MQANSNTKQPASNTKQPAKQPASNANVLVGPCTMQQLQAFVAKHGAAVITIQPTPILANAIKANSTNPLPFSTPVGTAKQQPAGKRAQILWAIAYGTPVGAKQPNSNVLEKYLAYSGKIGASTKAPLDLLAALNGGFGNGKTARNPHYGTAFVRLVAAPPKATKPATKPRKAASKPASSQQPAAPASQPAAPATAPASQPAASSQQP